MSDVSSERVAGKALVAGGILWTFAIFLHADASTTALATSVDGTLWALVHWAYLIGSLLLLGATILLFRTLSRGGAETWAAFALAAGGFAFTLDAASTGIHLLSFPALTDAITAGTADASATFAAAQAVNASLGGVTTVCTAVMVAALGFALRGASRAPNLGSAGIVLGGLNLILFVADTSGWTILPSTGLVGNLTAATLTLWFVALGTSLATTPTAK